MSRQEMMREECIGCIFNGESIKCAALELEWAWYNLLLPLPILRKTAHMPDPCSMREERRIDNENPHQL